MYEGEMHLLLECDESFDNIDVDELLINVQDVFRAWGIEVEDLFIEYQ
jgi:hypothetical protein